MIEAPSQDTAATHTVLSSINLGDILTLPDGRQMTARSKVPLPLPLGSMAGFVICGELEVLLSTPTSMSAPLSIYAPVSYLPESMRRARPVYAGVCSYWAPHLPAQRQAMGELLYRVAEVAGSIDPLVIVWRSHEPVVFVRASQASIESLRVLYMPRDAEDLSYVPRSTSIVVPPDIDPAQIPAPRPVPVEMPQEVPLYERFAGTRPLPGS